MARLPYTSYNVERERRERGEGYNNMVPSCMVEGKVLIVNVVCMMKIDDDGKVRCPSSLDEREATHE